MPKLKTKKAAAKRFKVTGTGKLKRFKANKQHKTGKKTSKKKKELRTAALVHKSNEKPMKKILPYL